MRDAALALSALLLAGVMTAMLIGWALVWATSCKEAPLPEASPTTLTTLTTTTTVLPAEPPVEPPS